MLDANGDYTFGQSQLNFLINTPAAVAQAVQTTLALFIGEWFLDITVGVPYFQGALGKYDQATADALIQMAIVNVQGVTGIASYSSVRNQSASDRSFTVNATINTLYGQTAVQIANVGNY